MRKEKLQLFLTYRFFTALWVVLVPFIHSVIGLISSGSEDIWIFVYFIVWVTLLVPIHKLPAVADFRSKNLHLSTYCRVKCLDTLILINIWLAYNFLVCFNTNPCWLIYAFGFPFIVGVISFICVCNDSFWIAV